ncbi:zinc-binding dehydrogenase [Mycobacterium montefiorense]|uniref:Oxidoreductase n=1 Tax=Mycobacterium montefiorense TaxID=154654 RepID=A0AA37PPG6_9MYCO|nr:zinc-binding dehydrogenase [Mycobacterium montefiorense]GBG40666.1 oxidoreductase [Mycobacterium montefiorense]GKU33353.1 oxidoreductase [Mycobacterium montefiorense]GKU41719.1 oxidoreductase [Mycobacterium montefiorense]GKU44849.1 oxidoreductase [Mycobacterium montefiorense]GKU52143.1 oxidoreductase [Mycobacterium montefiorense]
MKAWQVHGIGEPTDVLREVDRDLPSPGAEQVRIRVAAAGLGLPDVLMCRGSYPLTPPLPFTPGQELVGAVTAVGPGVDIAIGTRVLGVSDLVSGNGSFAAEALAHASTVFPAPAGMDDSAAAGFWIPNMTAWIGLIDRGGLEAGERLAVLGAAGGSGIAAVQLGKARGARVLAVVSDQQRAEFCRSLGADHVVVAHGETASDGTPLAHALREATDWAGLDVVFDPVGGAQGTAAMGALARDGRHLAVGFASGTWPTPDVPMMVMTNTTLVGVLAAGYSRAHLEGILRGLEELIDTGALRHMVGETVSFNDIPKALTRLGERKVLGKIVAAIDGS